MLCQLDKFMFCSKDVWLQIQIEDSFEYKDKNLFSGKEKPWTIEYIYI